MKNVFEVIFNSKEEIENFITAFMANNADYCETMLKSRFTVKIRGTRCKKHPARKTRDQITFYPVELGCYEVDKTSKVIPTLITPDGTWEGIELTPKGIKGVGGNKLYGV